MTTGPIKGHNARIFIDDAGSFAARECEVNLEVSTIETAHKDINPGSVGVTSQINIADIISATFSTSGILYTEGSNIKANIDKLIAGTQVAIEFTTDVTGDHVISFNAILTGANLGGSEGDLGNYSFDGKSTGDITSDTVV
tara:strand:- start:5401 stop:5823 length:423 start_codon:yes stop_codon:yes gene_type:complete